MEDLSRITQDLSEPGFRESQRISVQLCVTPHHHSLQSVVDICNAGAKIQPLNIGD